MRTSPPKLSTPIPERYSQKPLPPYRFIPGINAHPTRDQQGHSYGHEPVAYRAQSPENWQNEGLYLYGVDLFNHAFWWEAHEAWEGVWQVIDKDSPHGQTLQGLIQVAAAYIKWWSNEPQGMQKLFAIGRKRLEITQSQSKLFLGVDWTDFLSKLDAHFEQVLADQNTERDPLINYPNLLLQKQ